MAVDAGALVVEDMFLCSAIYWEFGVSPRKEWRRPADRRREMSFDTSSWASILYSIIAIIIQALLGQWLTGLTG